MAFSPHQPKKSHPGRKLKIIASAILILPISFLLIFAFGEITGGDTSGITHFIQLAPLILFLILAWKFPRAMGIFMMAVGIAFGVGYVVTVNLVLWVIALVEIIVFAPPIISGLLFFLAGRKQSQAARQPYAANQPPST